jgi:hypothetical protein
MSRETEMGIDSDAWPTPSIGDEVILTGEFVNGGVLRPLVVERIPEAGFTHVLRDRATGVTETHPSFDLTVLVDGRVPAATATARDRREPQLGEG